VIDVAIDQTARRFLVIVGALAPGTKEVQETTRYAAKTGADAVLVPPSYYIKASAEGLTLDIAILENDHVCDHGYYRSGGRRRRPHAAG
jgi:dihydrodipicolinate synthase/N-acetylneuraminate lyase